MNLFSLFLYFFFQGPQGPQGGRGSPGQTGSKVQWEKMLNEQHEICCSLKYATTPLEVLLAVCRKYDQQGNFCSLSQQTQAKRQANDTSLTHTCSRFEARL